MTDTQQVNQVQTENKPNDKEFNFRKIESQLREERKAREEAERRAEEAIRLAQQAQMRQNVSADEDDNDDEPYIDKKKLDKKLTSFERKLEEKIEKKAEEKAYMLLEKKEQERWVDEHKDFYDTMQQAEKFAEENPALANMLLRMPDGFERQKLVYENIKAFNATKQTQKQPSIQDKIDSNRRSPYYQPSGVGSAPYAMAGDFSSSGQKNAYAKMQELKARLKG